MKKLQQFFALTLILCLSAAVLMIPAAAADQNDEPQVIGFEDGSYVVTTIEYDQPQGGATLFATQSNTSGSKVYSYYNSSDELMWVFRVYGNFTYNGTTAKATSAVCSYTIYNRNWSFVEGSASCSGATATATGKFKILIFSPSVTVNLTCSPTGVLS